MRATPSERGQTLAGALSADGSLLPILELLSRGATFEVTSRQVGASARTVRRKVRGLCDAVGVDTTIELVVLAVRHDLV